MYVHGCDDTISKQSPLACRELLSACRGAVANHRAALQLPGMLYRGSQNSWPLAARGGSHQRTCGLAGLAMASLCAASLSVVDGYSTLLLAQLRSNVVIPRRAAAGPHCRTAGRAKCTSDALRCSVNGAASRQTMVGGAMTAWPALSEACGLCRLRVVFRHAAISPIHRRHLANPQARWVTLFVDPRSNKQASQRISSVLRPLSLEAPPLCFSPLPGALAAFSSPCSVMQFAFLASD